MPIPVPVKEWIDDTFPRPRLQVVGGVLPSEPSHVNSSQGWVEGICQTLEREFSEDADWEEYTDELENRVLNSPFNAITVNGTSAIPDRVGSKVHTVIEGPLVLELVHMTEVGVSAYTLEQVRMERDRVFHLDLLTLARAHEVATPAKILRFKETLPDYPRQCLSLYLSDGYRELQFLEYRPLPFTLGRMAMGIKLRLTNVPIIGGIGYLEPASMEVLGGSVSSLEQAHMARLRHGFRSRMVEELSLAKAQDIHPKGLYFMDPETEIDVL